MLGIARLLAPAQGYVPGPCKADEIVHVPAGLVIDDALAEPDHAAGSEIAAQQLLDPGAAQSRIAIGIEQALLSHQHRALPVDVKRTALVDHRRLIARRVSEL